MRTEQIKIYSFNELADDAQQVAIDNHRGFLNTVSDFECTIDDAKAVGAIMGIDIDKIYFSGFYNQGDGACFEGSYGYKKGSLKALKEHAPNDKELHLIAEQLQAIQKKYFYQLTANVSHSGHYYHELCTCINVYKGVNDSSGFYSDENAPDELCDDVSQLLREFMQWIYSRLESENDYINSDNYIKENILINEYEFLQNGELH